LLPLLIAGFGLITAGQIRAQTFTTLHNFSAPQAGNLYSNSDGDSPVAGLLLSGSTLYGTATEGGAYDNGTVFSINIDGTGFTTIHSFTNDGSAGDPVGGVILAGGTLYGAMNEGGLFPKGGGEFAINTDGTGFTNLHIAIPGSFNAQGFYCNSGGAAPLGLIVSNKDLYGTTLTGGSAGYGTVFTVKTDGTSYTNLHTFSSGALNPSYLTTNRDGLFPQAGLVQSGNTLFGTTELGGTNGYGTIFAVNTDGTGFRTLYTFTNGVDGSAPYDALSVSGNILYGTASTGGSFGWGTVFAVNKDGTDFATLHSFTAIHGPYAGNYGGTNADGATPYAGVIFSGNTLYGTTRLGGSSGYGTVYAVNTDGTGFTNLYSFTELRASSGSSSASTNSDGANPNAGLILSGNTLYGTAYDGGAWGYGTVFSLTLPAPPQPRIILSGGNINLTWPTNAAMFARPPAPGATFTLQICGDLGNPVWTPLQTLTATNGVFNFSEPWQSGAPDRFYRVSAQ
jgi:uncharacterized repeat protein (TIGR03803 family)